MNANVIITHSCNLRCKHCYMIDSLGNDDKDSVNNHIELFKRIMPTIKIRKINFTGGECTTSEKLIELLQWSTASGYETSIFTNGIALNKEIAQMCNCIHLSLDGDCKIHNEIRGSKLAFDGVLNTFAIAKALSTPLHIQTTINTNNLYHLPKLIPVYEEIIDHLNSITLECAVNKGNTQKNKISLANDDILRIRHFKEMLLEHFHYGITVRDNIYTVNQIEQFVIHSDSLFPFWIDLSVGLCYVFSHAFSFSLRELSQTMIEKKQLSVKNYLANMLLHHQNDRFVILDDF